MPLLTCRMKTARANHEKGADHVRRRLVTLTET
jgi:hypothetical protein